MVDKRYAELSLIARAFIETLSDEKVRSITLAADVFGDMDADTLGLLRNPKPELIKYLNELREEEIDELKNAIELVRGVRRTWRLIKWCAITFFGVFSAVVFFWEKLAPWFKITK